MGKFVVQPLVPLLLFSVTLTVLLAAYVVRGVAPSETFEILVAWIWSLLLALWVVTDARRRRSIPCYDFGLFCYLFVLVVAPAYCFWSRGWRGILILLVMAGTWMVPYVIAGMTVAFLSG